MDIPNLILRINENKQFKESKSIIQIIIDLFFMNLWKKNGEYDIIKK